MSVWLANKALRAAGLWQNPHGRLPVIRLKPGVYVALDAKPQTWAGRSAGPGSMTSETLLQGIGIQRVFVINGPVDLVATGVAAVVADGAAENGPAVTPPAVIAVRATAAGIPAPRPVLALPPPGVPVTARLHHYLYPVNPVF